MRNSTRTFAKNARTSSADAKGTGAPRRRLRHSKVDAPGRARVLRRFRKTKSALITAVVEEEDSDSGDDDGHEHDVHAHENNQRHIEQALEHTYIALVAVRARDKRKPAQAPPLPRPGPDQNNPGKPGKPKFLHTNSYSKCNYCTVN